jgi:hypothetical protein
MQALSEFVRLAVAYPFGLTAAVLITILAGLFILEALRFGWGGAADLAGAFRDSPFATLALAFVAGAIVFLVLSLLAGAAGWFLAVACHP